MVHTCIDICMAMVAIYTTSTKASIAHIAQRKQLRRREEDDVTTTRRDARARHEVDDIALPHPYLKQVADLLVWHIELENAR
jgi:hypothetical protein